MSNNVHPSELIAAYALGCLDENEAARVAEHLAGCPACQAELVVYQAVADQLALATPDADPPASLKQRLMARIQPSHRVMPTEPGLSLWQQLTSLFHRLAPAWGLVSLALVIALGVNNLLLWQRVNQPGAMRIVTLMGTAVAPDATGTVVIGVDGDHGALVVDGLAPLDEARQYQFWLIEDGQQTSGGVFSVDADGYGVLWVSSPQPLSGYDGFGITVEPAGGSPGPTGNKVLGGSL